MKTLSIDTLVTRRSAAAEPAAKLLSYLASQNAHPDHFYLTGFEGICVDAAHTTLTEALISSVVPFDGELLVVGTDESCALWRTLCHNLSIQISVLDSSADDLADALEAVLSTNRHITHVMCSSDRDDASLRTIGNAVRRHRRSFIVDNSSDAVQMADVDVYNIDFLMTAAADADASPVSLIVARRSKLVQAEGNARNSSHDIYALWQQIVGVRCPSLEPMAS